MDTIIEGRITTEEGMDEVIQTVLDLKSVPNAVLRVSCGERELNGRIAFGHNGYILGGRVDSGSETGYEAVRQLLSIKTGNFAIMDPGQYQPADINQTLWIKGEEVIKTLPDLPASPEVLLGVDPSRLAAAKIKQSIGQIDLRNRTEAGKKVNVGDVKSKARSFNQEAWRSAITLVWLAFLLVGAALFVQYSGSVFDYARSMVIQTLALPSAQPVAQQKPEGSGRKEDKKIAQ